MMYRVQHNKHTLALGDSIFFANTIIVIQR